MSSGLAATRCTPPRLRRVCIGALMCCQRLWLGCRMPPRPRGAVQRWYSCMSSKNSFCADGTTWSPADPVVYIHAVTALVQVRMQGARSAAQWQSQLQAFCRQQAFQGYGPGIRRRCPFQILTRSRSLASIWAMLLQALTRHGAVRNKFVRTAGWHLLGAMLYSCKGFDCAKLARPIGIVLLWQSNCCWAVVH